MRILLLYVSFSRVLGGELKYYLTLPTNRPKSCRETQLAKASRSLIISTSQSSFIIVCFECIFRKVILLLLVFEASASSLVPNSWQAVFVGLDLRGFETPLPVPLDGSWSISIIGNGFVAEAQAEMPRKRNKR